MKLNNTSSYLFEHHTNLFNQVDKLRSVCESDVYPRAFDAFNEVVTSCYGSDLHADFEVKINAFRQCYLELGISVTPKVHAVFHHVADFCNMTGHGLGPWSEQCAESIHHDFVETWSRFKVKDIEHPKYGQALLDAVCYYNSMHL